MLVFIGVIGLLLPSLVLASVFRDVQNISQDEIVQGNVYLYGSSPVMAGTVKGDLGIFGSTIMVSGNVEQDLFVAGGNVQVTGHVSGDVRAFGGEIDLDGVVDGEVLSYGGMIKIGPHAKIQGDVNASGGNIVVDPSAKILGKQNIIQGNDLKADQQSREVSNRPTGLRSEIFEGAYWVGRFIFITGILLVIIIFSSLYPKFFQQIGDTGTSKKDFWKNFGLGILLLIVTPIAAIISFITGIGILLGFILMVLYVGLILASMIFSGVLMGALLYRWIGKSKKFQLSWMWWVGGIILINILPLVPVIGALIGLIFFLLTCGTLVRTQWSIFKKA